MKHRSIGQGVAAIALLLLGAWPAAFAADYASMAWDSTGKSWGWAVRGSQAEANRIAMTGCNEGSATKDCQVVLIKAVAEARGDGRVSIGRSASSLQEARNMATESCGKGCRITFETTDPGFVAYARTKNDASPAHFYTAYAYSNSDRADQQAVAGCERNAGEPCRLVFSGVIGGMMKAGTDAAPPVAAKPAADASCRPRTASVRCSSQCTNGSCVVTYENGCRVRVQVNAQFDPFSNQWKYPAPSC